MKHRVGLNTHSWTHGIAYFDAHLRRFALLCRLPYIRGLPPVELPSIQRQVTPTGSWTIRSRLAYRTWLRMRRRQSGFSRCRMAWTATTSALEQSHSAGLLPTVETLVTLYPPGMPPVVLQESSNSAIGQPVRVTYLPTEQRIQIDTYYADGKSYIFRIDAENQVEYLAW